MRGYILILLAANAVSITATIGAAAVACSGHNGWGWLIFLAVVSHCSPGDAKEAK